MMPRKKVYDYSQSTRIYTYNINVEEIQSIIETEFPPNWKYLIIIYFF